MSDIILAVILIVAILAIAYYLIKKMAVLVVNAVLGLILLFILNFLQVMQWVGRPDLGYSLATLIICGVGGLPAYSSLSCSIFSASRSDEKVRIVKTFLEKCFWGRMYPAAPDPFNQRQPFLAASLKIRP